MINRPLAILAWLLNLFDPPPLVSMTQTQKIGRVFLLTGTLVVVCIITAMFGAAAIFVVQRAHDMLSDYHNLLRDLVIIVVSMGVNVLCVSVLLVIKKADHKLIPPPLPPAKSALKP